ncbi:transposase [Rhabdochlamydiaceae symbiont of Dictyostelium giganteum]|uniref:IS1634 family transposase n=1 Tax=Rhabdochlamydiaceae symbiont of Dictyostelium giganteum TaxID=3342349 RepID=UPI00384F0FC9
MKTVSNHPKWALIHKKPGMELRLIKGHYYLYEVSSKWNKEKKRAQKITGKILGKITEKEGFIPSRSKFIDQIEFKNLSVKTCGVGSFCETVLQDVFAALKKHFGKEGEAIYCASLMRLSHQAPLKNMDLHFKHDFLSESFPHLSLSDKKMTALLRDLGESREKINAFFKEFFKKGEHILVDMTAIHSVSKEMDLNQRGYNSKGNSDPQVNLLLLFSESQQEPAYYRLLPGHVRDVKSVKLSLKESGIDDAIFIADKGFYSKSNIDELEQLKLQYLIPLKRNHSLIDYTPFQKAGKEGLNHYFKFQERYIFCTVTTHQSGQTLYTFLDDKLKLVEEESYLNRIETSKEEELSIQDFYQKSCIFGTFALLTNITGKTPSDIYELYKSRMDIETAFDAFKNTLQADRTYMQNDQAMEGWMFINYLALLAYWRMLKLLFGKGLLSKFSIHDLLIHLSHIKKIKINGEWDLAEVTDKTKKLFAKLGYNIT